MHSQAHSNKVARQLNERPRKTLGYETPVEQIARAAEEGSDDPIVLATEGRTEFLGTLRGSVTENVSCQAPCPLLAVPARPARRVRTLRRRTA